MKGEFYETKYAFRGGIIDLHKRAVILKYFDLKSTKCYIDYHQTKKAVGMEFLNFTDHLNLSEKTL